MKTFFYIIVLAIFCCNGALEANEELNTLERSDQHIRALRSDINTAMFVVKSRRDVDTLPELQFQSYTLKKGDTLWNIVARTSLDMDTLKTVNALDSPADLQPGVTVFIPNMRGIVYSVKDDDTIDAIAADFKIEARYILKANKIQSLTKSHIFIPCGTLSKEERSMFMGTGFLRPVVALKITSNFGMRSDPFLGVPKFHSGVDIKCKVGTQVKSSRNGVVSFAGVKGNYGKLVIISHAGGYETYYGHLSRIGVRENQVVKAGQLVALSGNTGRSTGPHLHFEIRKKGKAIDPMKKLK